MGEANKSAGAVINQHEVYKYVAPDERYDALNAKRGRHEVSEADVWQRCAGER
jgi:hypothetical protein